jgi:hypothetical protein
VYVRLMARLRDLVAVLIFKPFGIRLHCHSSIA